MKGREFFYTSGAGVPHQDIELSDKAQVSPEPYKNPEIDRILDLVDFPELKSMLKEFAVRSGIDAESLNFLDKDRIDQMGIVHAASFDVARNLIAMNPGEVRRFAESHPEIESELDVLKTLIHEEVHATAKNTCSVKDGEKIDDFSRLRTQDLDTFQGGYWHKSSSGPSLFFLLNEGVTEKITREIFPKYVKKTGFKPEESLNKYLDAKEKGLIKGPYDIPVAFVDMLVEKIAKASGFTEKDVWHAFIRGAYAGELFDHELTDLLDEIMGPEFTKKMSTATEEEMLGIMNDMKSKEIKNSSLLQKLKKFFD